MQRSIKDFYKHAIYNFFEAVGNIFIFLPYFFSVTTLLSTLFSPWKNLTTKKTTKGFSFSEWFNRQSFNFISIGMGFVMRVSLLLFYILTQVFFFISLLVVVPLYVLCIPLLFLKAVFSETEEQRKSKLHDSFVSHHLLKQENSAAVESWFEQWYKYHFYHSKWWKLSNLFSMPPLARDWAVGYTPILDSYAEDLSTSTYQTRIKHIVNRFKEIHLIEQALSKTEEANVLIVGEEGVGKHTIIDAFAKKIYEGKASNLLKYKRVLKLNMERVLTQYTDHKQREEFLEELLREAAEAQNVILFIEHIDKYISDGPGRVDLSIPLEKFGKTSHLQIIGITSPFFYQKYFVPNENINRVFTKVDVYEISKTEALEILLSSTEIFEKRYRVFIPYETVLNTIEKSDFFITVIPFPEKAVQLLDMTCIYTTETLKKNVVMPEYINAVLTEKTHIPIGLTPDMKQKLLSIESELIMHVVNQESAVKEVASTLRRSFLLMGKRKKPLASFLFLGPTGVGKTETAKAVAQLFFNSEKNLLRFDMSLYQSKDDISKLVGSMDTQNPGLLTQSIREYPYAVLLLDELEKADKNLLNIFLTILDEGYFTDGYGKRVDCKNLIIVATSNAGVEFMSDENQHVLNTLIEHHIFSPEFLNRFDGIVTFKHLNQNAALSIAKGMLQTVINQIFALYKVRVEVADTTLQSIVKNNYDPTFGARNMERALRTELEDKVAKQILEGTAKEGQTIYL